VKDIDSRPPNWPVVWAVVSKHGWGGSPLMIGSHYCPRCCGAPPPGPAQHGQDADAAQTWSALTNERHAAVVKLPANFDVLTATQFGKLLSEALARHRNLVLDLSGVRTVDSTALGLLVRTRQLARERGGRLCLAAPSGFVATLLHTMRLTQAFEIFPGVTEALARLATHSDQPNPHRIQPEVGHEPVHRRNRDELDGSARRPR
jgi:anti-sigma B factor antagonist